MEENYANKVSIPVSYTQPEISALIPSGYTQDEKQEISQKITSIAQEDVEVCFVDNTDHICIYGSDRAVKRLANTLQASNSAIEYHAHRRKWCYTLYSNFRNLQLMSNLISGGNEKRINV